ncbi:hypothetical protein P280DRAFT_474751 [Massarina eburnea CBS 473.64]|uniref:Uncharacterized protein n=1 Tax=Massarina eburnea CBS 473.64 TaxID=1395130 RepID=A0A6A6RJL2_9PLEO|nr:hypothetical protein P280DRAFT_474751 [Massarina eburnea CBS 473.64]
MTMYEEWTQLDVVSGPLVLVSICPMLPAHVGGGRWAASFHLPSQRLQVGKAGNVRRGVMIMFVHLLLFHVAVPLTIYESVLLPSCLFAVEEDHHSGVCDRRRGESRLYSSFDSTGFCLG